MRRLPHEALGDALRPALRRPPCLVAFSGGRDSSLLLAAATRVARADGLPEPIPITATFAAGGRASEDEWQEATLAHVRPSDRVMVRLGTDLDALGEIARGALALIGPYEPFNAHFAVPLLAHARGGSLVMGIGGDELLVPGRWAHLQRLRRPPRTWPAPRTFVAAAVATAARPIGLRVLARHAPALPWITTEAQAAVALLWAGEHADPLRFDAQVRRAVRARALRNMIHTLQTLARPDDVAIHAPLAAAGVADALARAGGAFGFGTRAVATRALAGPGGLPEPVLRREDKAGFDVPLWGPEARAFAASWSGDGFDPRIIDAGRLRAAWQAESPDYRSGLLLHAAWCHDRAVRGG